MIAVVMEFLVWLVDFLFSERKQTVGRHRPETVIRVVADYHPDLALAKYRGLWHARMTGRSDYLRTPLRTFYAIVKVAREIDRTLSLSNYRWSDTPFDQWPESWRVQNG